MTDIAQLTYSVDSSGLKSAERALDSQAQAAERTAKAAGDLEDRYKAIARRGVEFAESMRTANISERAQAEAAQAAAAGIDVKARAMANASSSAERMAERVEAIRLAEEREARAAAESARQKALQELNLRKLLGQIDPTIAKLERLGQMEGQLERALDLGAITPEVFDHYQAKIDATRAATLNMGRAHDVATAAIGRLNLNTVEAQQSIASLARSMATGQWGMATSSFTSLAARTGAMGAAFSGAGLAVGGLAAGVLLFATQATKGYFEARRLEGVIIGMGNAAGVTTGQMLSLRNEIGRATGDYGAATQAINQLLLSGKATGETLEAMARTATQMANLTGQSVGTVTSELLGLADSGAAGLEKWNDKYNVLTASQWQNIEAIRASDGELAAFTATMREAERVSAERTQKMRDQAGFVETAWRAVAGSVRGAIQAMRDWGRSDLEAQLARAQRHMENMRLGAGLSDPETYGPYVQAKAAVEAIEAQIEAERNAERRRAASRQAEMDYMRSAMESERDRKAAMRSAGEEHERRLARMDREYAKQREINEVVAMFASLAADDPRRTDGSRERMLADIERRYAQTEKAARASVQRMSEEDRAVERLLSQFQRQEASMERQIALYGNTSRAAAMAYDIQVSGLQDVDAELARILQKNAEWLDFLDDMAALDKVWEETAAEHAKYTKKVSGQYESMSEHAKQAARNMQSHFARFLFDPFADGSKNMAQAFSETLRRMMAEAAASKIFEVIGGALSGSSSGFGQWLGGMLSGKREHGGPVHAGRMYQVGERNKPELLSTPSGQYLIPGEHGKVEPTSHIGAGGGIRMSVPPISVNLHGAPHGTTANVRQRSDGGLDIDILLAQLDGAMAARVMDGSSKTGGAFKRRYGLREAV